MTPFANWTFFGLLLLYAVLPILVLGLLGKASAKWCFIITLPILVLVFALVRVRLAIKKKHRATEALTSVLRRPAGHPSR